jgi:hypothetical protein
LTLKAKMESAKRSPFGRSLPLFGATTGAGALSCFIVDGPLRIGALAGISVAALTSAIALTLLSLAFDRNINAVLGAVAAGFLMRMLFLAVGLLAALRLKGEPIAFVVGFFVLYLAHQLIEIFVVLRQSRRPVAAGGSV